MSRNSNFSENEDDPEPFDSSGNEFIPEKTQTNNRRVSQRLSKKPKVTIVDSASTDEDDYDEEPRKRKSKKNGVDRNRTVSESNSNVSDEITRNSVSDKKKASPTENTNFSSVTIPKGLPASRGGHRKFIPKTIFSEDYATGSFVILKKDAQVGDPSKHPCIWRIDGKALLQKYEAFDEDGKVRHKNTSIYTGWSPMDKDLYAPVIVDVVHHSNQNLTVELRWETLKEINVDSD